MPARTLVPVEEYLHTSYDPDCDYVDGEVLERNVGEWDHSELQTAIAAYFFALRKKLRIFTVVEQRVQVSRTRFRVPDVCIMAGSRPAEQILTQPPLVTIEILSKDDRVGYMQKKIDDYLAFGVRYVWVIDPRTRRAWVYTQEGARESKDGILRTENPAIELPLPEIFSALE